MSFEKFDEVEKYLRFGTYSKHDKASKGVIRRCSKRFCWRGERSFHLPRNRNTDFFSKFARWTKVSSSLFVVVLDSALWYIDGKRQRKVLRSDEEVRAVLAEHHNNRKHAGRSRCLRAMSDMYYWRSMTKDIGDWIDNCKDCSHPSNPVVCAQCIVPHCESSGPSNNHECITFHRYDLHGFITDLGLVVLSTCQRPWFKNGRICRQVPFQRCAPARPLD